MSQTELLQQPALGAAPATPPSEPAYYFSPDDLGLFRREDRKAGAAVAGLMMTIFGLALVGYVVIMMWVAG
jgi:hypothetical protein